MIPRRADQLVRDALDRQAAVALLGPRQVGKTTLARTIADEVPSVYLDLEAREDRNKLADPALFLRANEDRLVVLDEIHRVPEVFQELRGLVDEGRRKGIETGRFLLLGSASMDLMRQSGETLAGRVAYVEMGSFDIMETGDEDAEALWVRGGFPDSYLAKDDPSSLAWRTDMVRTYLEREVPMFGPRVPAETLERLWIMLAHNQGNLLNASQLAAALMISAQTVTRYIDLLVDLLLVRRLRPYHNNIGKRLVKSPKVYIRDSGLVHALLNIGDRNSLSGHPVVGASWEGFIIENLISAAPAPTVAGFYRTAAGAEMDLVLEFPGRGLWAIEVKRGLAPKLEKGFHHAREDLRPEKTFVVYSGRDRYPMAEGVEAISVWDMIAMLTAA